jgi:hypothetical protein
VIGPIATVALPARPAARMPPPKDSARPNPRPDQGDDRHEHTDRRAAYALQPSMRRRRWRRPRRPAHVGARRSGRPQPVRLGVRRLHEHRRGTGRLDPDDNLDFRLQQLWLPRRHENLGGVRRLHAQARRAELPRSEGRRQRLPPPLWPRERNRPALVPVTYAQQACQKLLPNGGRQSTQEQAKELQETLEYAICMRAHGVPSFPDPKVSSDGAIEIGMGAKSHVKPQLPQGQGH